MDAVQQLVFPSIFPIWTNALLQLQSITSSRLQIEWVDPASLPPSVNVIWKYPDNATRNDIIPAGDYPGLRIYQQNATGLELIAQPGAGGSQVLFNVLDNSLGLLFKIDEIGRVTQGSGGGGSYNNFTNEVAFSPSSTAVAGGSSNNNLSVGRFTTVRLILSGGSGAVTVTGIDSGALAGRTLILINETGETVTLPHMSGSSSASNKFFNGNGASDVILADGDTVVYMYENSLNHWFLLSGSSSGGGGALTYWAESQNTSSPNNVVYATQWTPVTIGADSDAVIAPLGVGAFQLQIADGGTGGGDKRGTNAIDFSMLRSAADQVASGTAAIQWGVSNKTTGTYATTGGIGNDNAAALGFVFGSGNVSTGGTTEVYIFGDSNISINSYTINLGLESYAALYGQFAYSTGKLSGNISQTFFEQLKIRTTDSSTHEMFIDGSSERLVLADNSTLAFMFQIVARRTNTSVENDSWFIRGHISRGSGAGSVTTPVFIKDHIGTSSLDVTVSNDTTNGSLKLSPTGVTGHNVNWTATVLVTEIQGADA
jgi:hypothetical protein